MDNLTQKLKQKNKTITDGTVIKIDDTYPMKTSRSNSISSTGEERDSRKRQKMADEPETENEFDDIRKERARLEEFLFNDNNKISKSAAKFILNKWSLLEAKIQDEIMERKRFQAMCQNINIKDPKSYVQAVITSSKGQDPIGNESASFKNTAEVVLLKPLDKEDNRNNDEIKTDVTKQLKGVKSKLKVRNMKQMRQKGIVLEL